METTISFGYWVRRQRKALDLTQQALADRVGCSLAAIKKIESDERRPSLQIAERMADILGIRVDQREMFLEVARGLRSADQLPLAHEPEVSRETPSLPSGTVTFLFTDIEGSTKLAQQHSDAMPALLARHHEILHQSIQTHNGYVFQVVGDEFAAAFHSANDALDAALKAQHLLQNEDWSPATIKVRMGIHTGAAQLQDTSKAFPYSGYATIALTQRIMSVAHGGQILLSQIAHDLIGEPLSSEFALLDLGEHHLKDFLRPIHLYQVADSDLPADFPPLNTLDFTLNNLPVQLTSFIGREKEIADVIRLLEKVRLVTLTGPGGTGKTRLSVQVASELLDQYPNGVWFVELVPILDPLLIPRTTAIAMGLRNEPHRPIMDMLCDYLREKKMLIILDNCEHLIEACAQLADTLLHACPQIRILTSSREALGIAGETTYSVPSLTLPDFQHLLLVESLNQYEAIKLFIDRAVSAIPTFTLTDENASSVAQICQRLDGIPLAIELAAGKIRALSARQIAQRLDDRFRLLSGGSRTALERHQTLRAAIDWSYNLLSPTEQIFFRRLSIFIGGWTLEAAESVCTDERLQGDDILTLLEQLINKSLVTVATPSGDTNTETRYGMLETIREYAREKHFSLGEEEQASAKHLKYFLRLSEQAESALRGPTQMKWLARLKDESNNLRAALDWALKSRNIEIGLYIAGRLRYFWARRNFREGERWLGEFINSPASHDYPLARAKALSAHAHVLWLIQKFSEALNAAEECLALYRTCGDPQGEVDGLLLMENALRYLGTMQRTIDRKAEFGHKALALSKSLKDRWRQAQALANLGWDHRDYQRARAYWEEAVALFREVGDFASLVDFLGALAELEVLYGDFESAQERLDEAIEVNRQMNNQTRSSLFLQALSKLATIKGDFVRGHLLLEEAMAISEESGNRVNYLWARTHLAHLELRRNRLSEARDIFLGTARDFFDGKNDIGTIFNLEGISGLFVAVGKHGEAARLIGWSDAARERIGDYRPPIEQADFDRNIATCISEIGKIAFAEAYEEGRSMSFDTAVEFARGRLGRLSFS